MTKVLPSSKHFKISRNGVTVQLRRLIEGRTWFPAY
jgi:hypothetical protein